MTGTARARTARSRRPSAGRGLHLAGLLLVGLALPACAASSTSSTPGTAHSATADPSPSVTAAATVPISLPPAGAAGGPTPAPNRTSKIVGSGNEVVPLTRPSQRISGLLVRLTSGGSFQVKVVGGTDQLLLHTTSGFDGIRPLDLQGGQAKQFDVQATGPWTIEVIDPLLLPVLSGTYAGRNDADLVYTGPGGVIRVQGNPFDKPFSVKTYGTGGATQLLDLGVTLDLHRTLAPGPLIVEVRAKGVWSITPE